MFSCSSQWKVYLWRGRESLLLWYRLQLGIQRGLLFLFVRLVGIEDPDQCRIASSSVLHEPVRLMRAFLSSVVSKYFLHA